MWTPKATEKGPNIAITLDVPAELPKCHHWGVGVGSPYVLYRKTQYMKAQMSGKIFKLIKTFFLSSFSRVVYEE